MITRIPFKLANFTFLEIESHHDPEPLLNQLPESGLGVVGTRYPQHKSFDILEKTMAELKDSGLIIISGFARGIDSRAHELALENGLKTIAILGCGLNIDYPTGNHLLRKKILDAGGLILSPFERDTPAYASNFLERNRAIAYYSKAVWIVEAARISGSLNTARHAADLSREIYATACFPNDRYYEGNQDLLSQEKTHSHPIADLLFNAWSMNKTWSHLQPPVKKKKPFNRLQVSRIQKWVLEIQEESGVCTQQRLVETGLNSGLSSGDFFSEYMAELKSGKLKLDPNGVIDLP